MYAELLNVSCFMNWAFWLGQNLIFFYNYNVGHFPFPKLYIVFYMKKGENRKKGKSMRRKWT